MSGRPIIDQEGRLYGKINVIDALVILFLICILPLGYFGYKFLKNPPKAKRSEGIFVSMDTNVKFKNLDIGTAKLIAIGDVEKDDYGNIIGKILQTGTIESNFIEIEMDEDHRIVKEDVKRKELLVRLRLIGIINGTDFLYKDKIIKVGSPIVFKTDKYVASGAVVLENNESEDFLKKTPINVDVLFKNFHRQLARYISVGDMEIDKEGNVAAIIVKLGNPEPYKYKVNLGGSNYVIRTDPLKRQVAAKLEIMGRVEDSYFYFKNKRLALDSTIELDTNKYKIEGTIVEQPVAVKGSIKVPIQIELTCDNLSPDTASAIVPGDFEINRAGEVIATVLSMGEVCPYIDKIDLNKGTYMDCNDSFKRQVAVIMEVMGKIKGDDFYFKDKRISLDSIITFNTKKYQIKGKVVKKPIYLGKLDKEWVNAKVKFENLIPELAYCIKENDMEMDSSRKIIARIISVNISPSTVTLTNGQDATLRFAQHPIHKDVTVTMELLGNKTERGLIFKEDNKIKVGSTIYFETDNYDVQGIILEMKKNRDK